MTMFSMYLQSGIPRFFPLEIRCGFNIESTVLCLCISTIPPNASSDMEKHGFV